MFLHMTALAAWEGGLAAGSYQPPSLVEEGFIHCSTSAQLEATANRFYRGLLDRVVLVIDPARLDMPVRWEGDPEAFPHLYGPLNPQAVVDVIPWVCDPSGRFKLIPELELPVVSPP